MKFFRYKFVEVQITALLFGAAAFAFLPQSLIINNAQLRLFITILSVYSAIIFGVWVHKYEGLSSPLWNWLPPFIIFRNTPFFVRGFIIYCLIFSSLFASTIILIKFQRVKIRLFLRSVKRLKALNKFKVQVSNGQIITNNLLSHKVYCSNWVNKVISKCKNKAKK